MPKISGKLVHLPGIVQRKNSAQLSTRFMDSARPTHDHSAKARLILPFIPFFPQLFSPTKPAPSPLFEHYFYSVSTTPTIRTTKENLKER